MMKQMIVGVRAEDLQVIMVAEAIMKRAMVVIRMEERLMDVVEDQQQEEIQTADLLKAGVEVLQEIQMEGHHPPELQMGEVVTGAKAHQQKVAIALHQLMEEELVVKRAVLLQAAGEVHVDVVNER